MESVGGELDRNALVPEVVREPDKGSWFLDPHRRQSHNIFFLTHAHTDVSCRTATSDFFFDLAESKVAVFLCSILTSDGVSFCFGKNSFP